MGKHKNRPRAYRTLAASRIATGRKNYLSYDIQGTEASVYYSLERLNEVNVYFNSDNTADRGYRTVFLGPDHKGYDAFNPAPGIAIGFNDIKTLEVHEFLSAVVKGTPYICDFKFGATIDLTVSAILQSAANQKWVDVKDKIPNHI